MAQNQASNEDLIQMANQALKGGQKDGARMMFMQVYNRDRRNERAMLGLARVAKTPSEREMWLKRVLKVNPSNEVAQVALKKLHYQTEARDNRTLLVWGGVALILFIIVAAVIAVVLLT
jgi:Tfp pilus assembly protein PilF